MEEIKKRYLLAEDTIDETDLQSLIEWLKTNPWLTQGPLVNAFEKEWAQWLGTSYATYVNSGSSANLLLYATLAYSNKLRNKKVIVPAISWPTTITPAIQLGFEPILCEADTTNFGLDVNHLESLLKKHDPATVILVHVLGVPNSMKEIMKLKERYNFILLEDSCAAVGSRYDNQLVGTFGEMSSFSFYFGHHLSTIEGGMVCTNDENLHDLHLQLRSHGWAKDLSSEKAEKMASAHNVIEFNRPFTFYLPGFNLRSTDLNAHIGLSQMKKINAVLQRRIENHKIYQARFSQNPSFHFQKNEKAVICSIAFVALTSSLKHREEIASLLKQNGIETRPLGGGNMSRQPYWEERYGTIPLKFADRIHETSFQLPNHPSLTPSDINAICDVVV